MQAAVWVLDSYFAQQAGQGAAFVPTCRSSDVRRPVYGCNLLLLIAAAVSAVHMMLSTAAKNQAHEQYVGLAGLGNPSS
jgi:hypothetical protein